MHGCCLPAAAPVYYPSAVCLPASGHSQINLKYMILCPALALITHILPRPTYGKVYALSARSAAPDLLLCIAYSGEFWTYGKLYELAWRSAAPDLLLMRIIIPGVWALWEIICAGLAERGPGLITYSYNSLICSGLLKKYTRRPRGARPRTYY